VGASHTDGEGLLKLVSALDMMQDCSQLWLESEPALERYFREQAIAQMLVSRQVDVWRMPAYGEKLILETRIYDCKNFLGYRNTVIYDEQERPRVVSWSVGAFVNLESGTPERLPAGLMAGVRLDPKFEMDYAGKKIALPDEAGERLPPLRVGRNDIDFNRHMNNARYVQIAVELLPENFSPTRLRIEYKAPARQGDPLYPVRVTRGNTLFLLLTDNGGRPYTVMEFSSPESLKREPAREKQRVENSVAPAGEA
jgi:acyl-ACP thioesterase